MMAAAVGKEFTFNLSTCLTDDLMLLVRDQTWQKLLPLSHTVCQGGLERNKGGYNRHTLNKLMV